MIKSELQSNGDVKFIITSKDDVSDTLEDTFEPLTTNGWLWIPPEEIGALTDAPIISNDATIEDDCSYAINGKVWAYMNYQILDPNEELKKHGEITFNAGN